MKTVFDDFEKATLIAFIQEQGYSLRYKKKDLLRQLHYLEWDRKAQVAQEALEKASNDMQKIDTSTLDGKIEWYKAQEAFSKALKLSQAADKRYEMIGA